MRIHRYPIGYTNILFVADLTYTVIRVFSRTSAVLGHFSDSALGTVCANLSSHTPVPPLLIKCVGFRELSALQ